MYFPPIVCPISCGKCCCRPFIIGTNVLEGFGQPWQENGYCKHHMKDRGCSLPRSERPEVCLTFLCPKAEDKIKETPPGGRP
jgi:hypothetical protein